MTTNDWSIHDGTALRAVLPLTITRAGRDPYGRTFVCGAGWRLDLLCDWTLADPAGVVLARDQDPDEAVRAAWRAEPWPGSSAPRTPTTPSSPSTTAASCPSRPITTATPGI